MADLNSKTNHFSRFDPDEQLRLLNLKCSNFVPVLYKAQALYLQTLRSILLSEVRNAIFSLLTNELSFQGFLSDDRAKTFQLEVDHLVGKCNSVLTVEHLMNLSKEIKASNLKELKRSREKFISNLEDKTDTSDENYVPEDINISLDLPISNPSQIDEWFLKDQVAVDSSIGFDDIYLEEETTTADEYQPSHLGIEEEEERLDSEIIESSTSRELGRNDLEVLKSLFIMAGDTIDAAPKSISQKDADSSLASEISVKDEFHQNIFFPNSPLELIKWTYSFEEAVDKRLRNLSNALNMEMLKVGILNNLVPVGMLDAVMSGTIGSQSTISNLLKISIPVGTSVYKEAIDIICLLIRLSELEFDNSSLRTCRTHLTRCRNELAQMVRKQRYWQGRSFSNEVHQKWWKNPPEASTTNS